MLKRKKQPIAEAASESTDVRFGMRGLLATMLVVAVASAALGPFFRDLAPDRRGEVITAWCAALAIVLALVGYHAWNRIRLEQLAGSRIVTVKARARVGFVLRPWLVVFGGMIWIAIGLYYLAVIAVVFREAGTVAAPRAQHVLPLVTPCIVSAVLISMGIVMIWWGRGAQLREHGILRGLRLLRWTHVTAHRWQGDDLYLEGVDQRHRDVRLAVVVGDKDRDVITHLIAQKLGRQAEASPEVALGDEEFSEKKLPLVRIRSGTDVTLRGMLTGFTVYVLLVVFLAARPWGRPPTQFMIGIGIGFVIAALTWFVASMRAGEPGAPLIRLAARWDWPSILASLLVAVGGYFLVQRFVFPPLAVAVGLGICSGLGAATLVEMMLRERFDLCENGIMLVRWRFLPWRNVRVLCWERTTKGALLVRSGWRRLAATVPEEQRDAVDRVLAEKLPSEMAREARRG